METSQSLLDRLAGNPQDQDAWFRLDAIYRPLLQRWLRRDPGLKEEDVQDLVQEVMSFLICELPGFRRQRSGSFRRWLREITARRLQTFFRQGVGHPRGRGGPLEESPLIDLSDPHSELSRQWDEEHDRYVLGRLVDLIRPQFEDKTIEAFCRVFFDGAAPTAVAQELGLSINAVLVAKSRVLNRLRQEAVGFLD
jgi:RNA polymerase sigma-70 factor (ECF subfamily)